MDNLTLHTYPALCVGESTYNCDPNRESGSIPQQQRYKAYNKANRQTEALIRHRSFGTGKTCHL